MSEMLDWLRDNRIDEVECLVPDLSGIARGKIVPTNRFIDALEERGLRIPEAVFLQTVTGDFVPGRSEIVHESNRDIYMQPDPSSLRSVPWYAEPVAQAVCDAHFLNGDPVDFAPRQVLKRVLAAYAKRGLRPVVAPELEFYLINKNLDPDYPLEPAAGLSGRQESGRQAYGIEAANEFDPVIEDIYDFCEDSRIDIGTMAHEAGAAQIEINFNHGDPLDLADQVFLFKRTVRQAALKHDMYATFMARPHQFQPGSSMHIHQSVLEAATGRNIFATHKGKTSRKLLNFIGGLQKYTPAAMPLLAPNVNSYRRITPYSDAPINTHWGRDNRTVGLRVPDAKPEAFRVENRVGGADANPYLAMAGSLACGLIGLKEKIDPGKPVEGDAYRFAFTLPRHLGESLSKLNYSRPLRALLGERFVRLLTEVKNYETDLYQQVISSWERENLLLNV
ncbi:MAG: glutamine synthetase family protein [Alphaproteobacteria bacterium]|nr:glutamine synthetase family protein [Alphaproteobacteria bacterium]